ncbi:MAG: sialate O-acetylesterase [Lachnospiraceae bacterium]|nr:sialate O-acetylesterase [Lachnospiraceae bacterium]
MIHSFLMIGQSNMAGRGFVNEVELIKSDRLKVLRNGRWQTMYVPVNCDRSFSGISLAESFAEAYAKEHDVCVGLIPCADGGTSLEQWKEGSLLYDHAIYQSRLASRTSTIAGVLWHQGEADCEPDRYSTYQERFEKMMAAFRRDLELYDVPFLVGGLGDYLKNYKSNVVSMNYVYVNEALKSISMNNEMTGFVSAEGLTSNPDNLHFNSKSLREFGIRYYREFMKLENKQKIFHEKMEDDSAIRGELEAL